MIGIIYRKPNTDVGQFQNSLLGVLEELNVGRTNIVLIGDFNIDVSQTNNQKVCDYLSMIESIGMQQVISSPTRVTDSTSSVIDHIYTNVYNPTIHSGVIETDISDHFPIFIIFESKNKNKNDFMRKTSRSYKSFNAQSFHEDLGKIKWAHICRYEDVNTAYRVFHDMFVKVCDKHAPTIEYNVSRKKSGPKKPWISSAILKSIKKKHTLYKNYKSANFSEEYGNKYKRYRNTLVTVIKNAKRLYYCNSFNCNRSDMRKTWETINELIGRKSKNKKLEIEELIINQGGIDRVVSSEREIAEELNNYFVSVGSNLAERIPNEPTNCCFKDYLGVRNAKSLAWIPIREE